MTESEEAIVDEGFGKAWCIVKTTHFIVWKDTGSRPSRKTIRGAMYGEGSDLGGVLSIWETQREIHPGLGSRAFGR